jgi:hypothetical protein
MLYMHTLTQQSGCLATGYYRLPQCCQLLADFSGQFGGKIRPLRKQIGPIAISPFWRRFLPLETKLSLFVSVGKVKFKGRRVEKQTFQKFGPFFALSAQCLPKFGAKFFRPHFFLFGLFWGKRPNIRPVGNTGVPASSSAGWSSRVCHRLCVCGGGRGSGLWRATAEYGQQRLHAYAQ